MSKINPQPKKLTLEQALRATLNPIKRLGDLIWVNVDTRIMSNPECEMRSIFMPSYDVKVKDFSQPETENCLRELYSEQGIFNLPGRIESISHFSDEALALHYNYGAGFVTRSGLAFDAGDPSQFEADLREALAQLPNLSRETVEIVRKTTLLMHKKYKLPANSGRATSGANSIKASLDRPIKNDAGDTLDNVISSLATNYPDEKPSELWDNRLEAVILDWSDSDCKMTRPDINKRDNWFYTYTKNGDTKDTIRYQSFRKKVKASRKSGN